MFGPQFFGMKGFQLHEKFIRLDLERSYVAVDVGDFEFTVSSRVMQELDIGGRGPLIRVA